MKKSFALENSQALHRVKTPKMLNSIHRESNEQSGVDVSSYLMGSSKLRHFLRFVRSQAIDTYYTTALTSEWQAASDHYQLLAQQEAGAADEASIVPVSIDAKSEPMLIKLLQDPLIKDGFDDVPSQVAYVDLDQLVVYQNHIDLTFVKQLQSKIGATPSDEEIFRTCLPYDHPLPPSAWNKVDDHSYVFVSRSNDMRYLGAMPLEAKHIHSFPHPGQLLGVIGLAVGFGSNFLNVIHAEGRLILHNGSHRAYALRALGIRKVPCIIQHASTREEFALVAPADVVNRADFFLKHPRPPMLQDYFNPKLNKIVEVRRVLRQIKVNFSVSEIYVPALS